MEHFRSLGIPEQILKSLSDKQFKNPTEIQKKAIPLVLKGHDVIAESATGSGKTLVFGAAIINSIEARKSIQALILTPTRELAEQVSMALKGFARYKHLSIISVYGGVSINPQIHGLRTADVVVGTPGRILDHMDRRTIDLGNVSILVLDEADRMLDMGFKDDVEQIIRVCPRQRQTMFFSATISSDIEHLSKRYMKDPIKVSAEAYVDPKKLKQVYYDVEDNMKFSLLVHILRNHSSGLGMIFCNTRRNADFVASNLKEQGINAVAIHGGLTQAKRSHIMELFNSKRASLLVCTDVAARGLDIPGVTHVYNYDIPAEGKQFIHRVGRTARAGAEGKSITILSPRDYDNFQRVLREVDLDIICEETPEFERVPFHSGPRRQGFGGERSRRPFPRSQSHGGGGRRPFR